jgi:hypothetical protein
MKQKSARSKIEEFRKEFISLARKGAGGYATIARTSQEYGYKTSQHGEYESTLRRDLYLAEKSSKHQPQNTTE